MERKIVGFHQDEESHWVADLDCGHPQHVRHKPPLVTRPWVLTPEGRQSRMGAILHCVRCDQREIPDHVSLIGRSDEFTARTIPKSMTNIQQTASGEWGRIMVLDGELDYELFAPYNERQTLSKTLPGIILPEVQYRLILRGEVKFFVESFRVKISKQW